MSNSATRRPPTSRHPPRRSSTSRPALDVLRPDRRARPPGIRGGDIAAAAASVREMDRARRPAGEMEADRRRRRLPLRRPRIHTRRRRPARRIAGTLGIRTARGLPGGLRISRGASRRRCDPGHHLPGPSEGLNGGRARRPGGRTGAALDVLGLLTVADSSTDGLPGGLSRHEYQDPSNGPSRGRSILAVGFLSMVATAAALAQAPPNEGASGSKPPWQRVLQGDDANRVEALGKTISELEQKGQFAEAVAPAREVLAIRRRVQGRGPLGDGGRADQGRDRRTRVRLDARRSVRPAGGLPAAR